MDAFRGDILVIDLRREVLVDLIIAQCLRQTQHGANVDVHLAHDPEDPLPHFGLDGIEVAIVCAVQAHAQC